MSEEAEMTNLARLRALIDPLRILIRSKQGKADVLRSIPDTRAYEDGSRLNLEI